ncbi:deoxyribodipyrimidine photo-lyase [Halorubrum ezzemoulense]|uniref:Deoxyribodipyrimidine photo-lyase n=1 Tax=Halorubrum ezzemoulense TaxID=337243 RepID=A0ABT4Z4E8_HALEZ|nr:deoxyribodipyrimidine photo-lyase [Halorubrum ezzemoulense]MDB2245075.1 deoxyribodipyrimidine photo-lyase [Halorubrum ezzemoulense]MDB2252561.1 deoxyribodipyrimidine photo-lyase [Halorubrum ezzemoulense]MDB2278167.1 deoxyribodipyrimidine photo-lyase [Halorubrum ezzemoulense]MDB2284841.1 deoxyribodipyrimidine photo-lyase [Halorubrum ezzemoulense]MDB2288411.1 deoxyribodipyrimidine photo-lyase [Halorubrum ezzemoulense]
MRLFWHRGDARTRDNAGLAAAARDGEVVPVFVYDADLLGTVGARQRAFFLRHVKRLEERYRELGSDLIVRAGDPEAVLVDLAAEYDAEAVFYNEQYRAARRNRQRAVEDALAGEGVDTDSRTDIVLVDPGRLEARYPNHSQFHGDWETVPKRGPYAEPDVAALADVRDGKTVPEPDADIDLPDAGYEAARERFDEFLDYGITSYNDTRDDLAWAVEAPTHAVSRMSPYLATGAIGVRELWAGASDVYDAVTGGERRNVDKYRYELSWREQMYHLLYYNPDLAVSNYKSFPNEIAWRDDDDAFEAWTRGETGYPLVDAGMRQLNEEGYIHNRPRQVVASFLTKHLLIDWRRGARYFTKQLIDHDYASNHGAWQWTASTGTDSVDVRIFDPVSQMSKYDDGARFVKAYVPELSDVPSGKVVDWPTLSRAEREELAPDYAHPIVDRNEGYERAQRVFEEALGKR